MAQKTNNQHTETGWTSSLDEAIRKATLNNGVMESMTYIQRRLLRSGYESEAITNTGGVTILNARALKVGIISRNNTDNTSWIDDPQAESKLSMAWGNNRTQKIKICSEYLPAEILQPMDSCRGCR